MGSGRGRSLLRSARAAATAAAGAAEGAGDPGPRRAARLLRQADGGLGLGKDRRSDLARSRRTGGENAIKLRRIAPKLVEPLADGGDQRDQSVGKRRLEGAKALTGEATEDLLDTLAGDRGVHADKIL